MGPDDYIWSTQMFTAGPLGRFRIGIAGKRGEGVCPTVEAQMKESIEIVGVFVEMCTETPHSQQSIETQNMLQTCCTHLQVFVVKIRS